jgi:hypothetical protein
MMSSSGRIDSQPGLGDLLDLSQQMKRDGDASGAALRHRDRRIGRELAELRARPVAQLLGWLQRIREQADYLRGDRVDVVHRLGLLVLGIAGLLSGWGAAAVVLHYDGTHPVNVIHFLAVFVLLQLLTVLFFGIGLLPPGVTRFIPGMRTVQETLGFFSPGRLQRLMTRYLPQSYRDIAASLLGKGRSHQRLFGRVDRWVVAHSSQTFAVLFNLGALASCLYLVVFSDLAFSWSTTLQLQSADMQRWTDFLSAPWAKFFTDARPSLNLIEETRYFRLKEGAFPEAASPAGLGGWWPFLVMCLVVYGLLPRLLTWLLARLRLRAALRRTFRRFPGTADLLVRLNSELVETRSQEPEAGAGDDLATGATAASESGVRVAGRGDSATGRPMLVVNWSAAAEDAAVFRAWVAETEAVTVEAWHEAGGAQSLAQDRQVVDAVAQGSLEHGVMILVKAWEPPMKEFLDFLRELRSASPRDRGLMVVPLGRASTGVSTAPEPHHFDLWSSVLTRLGDPWLSLFRLGGDRA